MAVERPSNGSRSRNQIEIESNTLRYLNTGRDGNARRVDKLRRDTDALPGVVQQPAVLVVGVQTLRLHRATTTTRTNRARTAVRALPHRHVALLHCALAAAQCIVIGPVCGFVCGFFVCLFVGLLPR